jgi:hypothetical protein
MTMHLMTGYSSLRTRKYKPVMTKANIAKWEKGMVVHNRQCKRLGESKLTFEQYVDYAHGIAPERDLKRDRSIYRPTQINYRQQIEYPSAPMSATCDTSKKESLQYTGERKLLGIATMHKSNAVPIFEDDKQHAIDIARMRR